MKRMLLQLSSVGLLLACVQATPLYSADEGTAPVPSRANADDPNSEVYRASDVMNMPVKDEDGNEVGKIKDFVINGESREVLYAVVAMNDGKEKDALYVMPWTAFQPNYAQQGTVLQYTVLTVPQSVWIQAPFYSANQWRTTPYSQWGPKVNNYYSQHVTVNNNSRRGTVSANKPSLKDDKNKDADDKADKSEKPRRDGDKPQREERDKSGNKDNADKAPAPKQPAKNVEPKAADKPAPKPQEPQPKAEKPKENDAKIPAPKTPDPAGPNSQNKPAPKNPLPNPK